MKNFFMRFFNKKYSEKTQVKVRHIPDSKKQVYEKLQEIMDNLTQISHVCELSYGGFEVSDEEMKCLRNIEVKNGKKFVDKMLCDLNRIPRKDLKGYRFTYKNQRLDLFVDRDGYYFLGQSSVPNHKVFNLNNEYKGTILDSGLKFEYEILMDCLSQSLWSRLLGEIPSFKFKIDLANQAILEKY